MVPTLWTTLRFGKPSSHRSQKPNCSHWIHERGVNFFHHIDCWAIFFLFPYLTCDWSHVQAARAVVKNNLSLIIFPEGTRSKDGRLLPFKKVIVIVLTFFANILDFRCLRCTLHSGGHGSMVYGPKWPASLGGNPSQFPKHWAWDRFLSIEQILM